MYRHSPNVFKNLLSAEFIYIVCIIGRLDRHRVHLHIHCPRNEGEGKEGGGRAGVVDKRASPSVVSNGIFLCSVPNITVYKRKLIGAQNTCMALGLRKAIGQPSFSFQQLVRRWTFLKGPIHPQFNSAV
jgi:hypothetical protein